MDFISNLIKRPISLVLSDSVEVSSSSSSPSAQQRESYSVHNNNNNNVHNLLKNNSNNKNNMNNISNSAAHDAVHEASRNPMLPLIVDVGAGGDGLHTGHCDFEHVQHLNSSTSSNSTSSTIEELLIQINDNLNQATLQDTSDNNLVAAANEMSTVGGVLTPLAAKSSSTHKLSQSPHPQTPTSPTVFVAPPSPNVAAGPAVFEANTLKIDSDLVVAGNLDKTHLVLNNNNTGAPKRNKFVGLTEFDESNIPELPESVNPNIGDQIKLTFDEDLIPTLTAHSTAQLNLPNKRDDGTKTLQVINNETDTAVSSDNETYAECQSFPDLTNATTTIDLGYGEHNTSLSEADAYRSALNSYNDTTIDVGNSAETKHLDETLENVADIGDKIFEVTTKTVNEQLWQDMMSTKIENRLAMPHNATFGGDDVEAMDVDLNETHELAYTTNVTMEADHLHGGGDVAGAAAGINEFAREATLAEFKDIPTALSGPTLANVTKTAEHVDGVATGLTKEIETVSDKAAHKDVPDHHCATFSVGNVELPSISKATPTIENLDVVQENQVQSVKLLATNSIDVAAVDDSNQTTAISVSNDMNLIQDNSVDSATDAPAQEDQQSTPIELPNPHEAHTNELISSSVAEAQELVGGNLYEKELNSSQPSSSSAAAATSIDRKFNLTLEINTSASEPASNKQTSSHSPSFPIRPAMNSKYFPRSPDVARPMKFLEKSNYSTEDVLIVTPTKKCNASKVLQINLNKTIEISDGTHKTSSPLSTSSRSPSIVSKSSSSLNCTFEEAMTSQTTSADKRRTFNASPTPPKSQLENSLNSSRPNSRLTFDAKNPDSINSDVNSLPSPTMPSSAAQLETVAADKRRTFNASSPPPDSQLENSLNSSRPNSRLTFNVLESEHVNPDENSLETASTDKRRTFNGTPTPPNAQLHNSLNSSRPNSRLTFNAKEQEQIKADLNSLPSSATQLEKVSTDKRRTFNASPPPPSSQLENSLNTSRPNSRLTFDAIKPDSINPDVNSLPSPTMPSTAAELETVATDKRRTLNASSPPTDAQLENSLNSSRPNSRLTFNVPESEQPACNQTFEAMDVDSSMHTAPSHTPSPRKESPPSPRTSPSITCSTSSTGAELLSAKEQTKSNAKDEKDIFVEKFSPSAMEDIFKPPSLVSFNRMSGGATSVSSTDFAGSSQMPDEFGDEDFQNNLILNPSDFDYLLTKGNSNVQVDRSSLLLKFDPLLGVPIPVNQPQQQQQQLLQILANNNPSCLSPTLEEEEHLNDNNRSFVVESDASLKPKANTKQIAAQGSIQSRQPLEISQEQAKPKKNARMSVDVIKDMKIENDCNKSIENSNSQSDDIQNNFKMDELEKKIKNEVLKTEDIEKKLKEAEQREEALIKRITEKDKANAKMNGVIEAYEKAIAELISEKEQLIQNYEKQLAEVKADRDSNYHHLTSLETTFSDLHVKYEKSKEMTSQLKSSEESLLLEKKQNLENLRLQEQRYEKMKNHAMQQLEIANKKLESLTKEHAIESTKLKALLKKEEISRASINEQLQQKSRENAELMKICDELINGQGS